MTLLVKRLRIIYVQIRLYRKQEYLDSSETEFQLLWNHDGTNGISQKMNWIKKRQNCNFKDVLRISCHTDKCTITIKLKNSSFAMDALADCMIWAEDARALPERCWANEMEQQQILKSGQGWKRCDFHLYQEDKSLWTQPFHLSSICFSHPSKLTFPLLIWHSWLLIVSILCIFSLGVPYGTVRISFNQVSGCHLPKLAVRQQLRSGRTFLVSLDYKLQFWA